MAQAAMEQHQQLRQKKINLENIVTEKIPNNEAQNKLKFRTAIQCVSSSVFRSV